MLTFVVGQIQYAYSSYFCTMMQRQVKAPTMAMNPATATPSDVCDECQAVAMPARHGVQLAQGDCMELVTSQKHTLDNFTEWSRYHAQFAASFSFVQMYDYTPQLVSQSFILASPANSPPLDLPILNSNLRI